MRSRFFVWLPVLASLWMPVFAQPGFEGPSILSRGTRPIGRGDGRPVRIRGFVGFGVMYSDGLGAPGTTADGKPYDVSGYGGNVSFGAYGSRTTNRDTLSVDYSGGVNVFSKSANYYSGLNQSLALNYSRKITNRWSMFSGVNAMTANSSLALYRPSMSQNYFANPYNPTNELFDNRMYSFGAGAGAAYKATSRLSFSMAGSSGTIVRRSQGLVSHYMWGTSGEVNYVLDAKTNVGATYNFGQLGYRRGFGDAVVQSWMGMYGRQLTRRWVLGVGMGLYRAEMNRLAPVRLDPFLASIIGQALTVERFHSINQGLAANVNLGAAYRKSSVNFNYFRGVNPGNGVFLTSQAEGLMANWSYNGFRRLNFGAGGGWSRMKALLETSTNLNQFEGYSAFTGMSYRLTSFLHFNASLTATRAEIVGPNYLRSRYMAMAGLSFSPGEIPLMLW